MLHLKKKSLSELQNHVPIQNIGNTGNFRDEHCRQNRARQELLLPK